MAAVETVYRDLLNPIKDPEKSFEVNISDLLQSYINSFVQGKVPPNFNSAALLLQGSSCIYGKKVEYLYNLAKNLHHNLKDKNNEPTKKDTKEREKAAPKDKYTDLGMLCSTEVKPGKNLCVLRRKNILKSSANKKVSKKAEKKHEFVPVVLLPLEGEEKGEVFYDTRGDPVGNKADYIFNKCPVEFSSLIRLPTICRYVLPTESSPLEYSINEDFADKDYGLEEANCDMPQSSPGDEGYPASPPTEPESEPVSQDVPLSQGTDEGLGSAPCTPQESNDQPNSQTNTPSSEESPAVDGGIPEVSPQLNESMEILEDPAADFNIENIPIEDSNVAPKPRRSMRQALKLCQIQEDGQDSPGERSNGDSNSETRTKEIAVVKKEIQKKNTRNLPSKLKDTGNENNIINPAPEFCARTFFSLGSRNIRNYLSQLEVTAFRNNAAMLARVMSILEKTKADNKRKKILNNDAANTEEGDDEEEQIDLEGLDDGAVEIPKDAVTGNELEPPPLEAADIVIEKNMLAVVSNPSSPHPPENEMPMSVDDPENFFGDFMDDGAGNMPDVDLPDDMNFSNETFKEAAQAQCQMFKDDIQQYVQTSDISERVHEWEKTIKPFLEKLNQREAFDINLYGSRILNKFEDSNRKQTMVFRDFCKGKEKWEIHRYFMALLPLVNVGNVSIEAEARSNGEEDILMTLLSRKMHHKELEEFGHGSGEH